MKQRLAGFRWASQAATWQGVSLEIRSCSCWWCWCWSCWSSCSCSCSCSSSCCSSSGCRCCWLFVVSFISFCQMMTLSSNSGCHATDFEEPASLRESASFPSPRNESRLCQLGWPWAFWALKILWETPGWWETTFESRPCGQHENGVTMA